jgi:hypothetical protein
VGRWRMNPDGLRQRGVLGWSLDEAFRVRLVGSIENGLSRGEEFFRWAVGNGSRGHQLEARVVRLVVVPREELLAETSGLFAGPEAVGEARPISQCFEGGLRVGVVVGDRRATMRLDDTEIS